MAYQVKKRTWSGTPYTEHRSSNGKVIETSTDRTKLFSSNVVRTFRDKNGNVKREVNIYKKR